MSSLGLILIVVLILCIVGGPRVYSTYGYNGLGGGVGTILIILLILYLLHVI
jgi:hypothetical protein